MLGSRLSNAFFPAGVTAVAWCSPLPTSRPRKMSMSPVSITCRPLRSRSRPASPRAPRCHTRVTESSSGLGQADAQAPHQWSVDASGPGDTTPRIINNKGGKSCWTRRPEAPLRSHEDGNGGAVPRVHGLAAPPRRGPTGTCWDRTASAWRLRPAGLPSEPARSGLVGSSSTGIPGTVRRRVQPLGAARWIGRRRGRLRWPSRGAGSGCVR